MTFRRTSTAILALLLVAGSSAAFAQDSTTPGKDGTEPLTPKSGVGRDSKITGYSESGRGGGGGVGGGPSTNGTAAGAGTATGGNPSGYPDRN